MSSQDVKLSSDIEVTSSSPDDLRLSKRWGYISAYPHEYLIHFHRGKLSAKSSGQGARCFKMPEDTVFIIPTSLKEIVFQFNQLSADNVDVRIRGIAIYRISNPLKIYNLLNFSNRQQAEEKLARMLGDLCRSTAKWLVSNMGVEECMRKRKEEIAEALKNEVSILVADPDKGWGVEVVTVDIQDVFIHDSEIFEAMQILFKTQRLRESQLSQLETQKALEVRKLEQDRELAEYRKNNEMENARTEAEIRNEKNRLLQQSDERQFALDRYRAEQNEELANYKLEKEIERDRQRAVARMKEAEVELEARKLADQVEIDAMQRRMQVQNDISAPGLEKIFIETALPALADAMARQMNNSRVNIYQGDGNAASPFKFMLTELVDILRERLENAGGNNSQSG